MEEREHNNLSLNVDATSLAAAKFLKPNLSRPIVNHPAESISLSHTFNNNTSSTTSCSSPPELVRQLQAALKRHRPLGTMRSSGIGPRRCLVSRQESSKDPKIKPRVKIDARNSKEDAAQGHILSVSASQSKNVVSLTGKNREDASITQPSEWDPTGSTLEENLKRFSAQRDQPELSARSGSNYIVASSAMKRGSDLVEVKKKVHFATKNNSTSSGIDWDGEVFLQNDLSNAMTQSSVVEPSCVTSTLISNSAPMISSTTYSSQKEMSWESFDIKAAHEAELQASHSSCKRAGEIPSNQSGVSKGKEGNVTDTKSQHPESKASLSDVNLESSKLEKAERGVSGKAASTSRKKGYDPELFFKVNGKLYQRLGKIGSGGSSEVHKVISSDCQIYALKKIKLKGRDYATAHGFCQEIKYLNTLKGKSNIIQLIDYEVTDKSFLQEVMDGAQSNKDYRVKNDEYIYMVLEYGEIDLAHMLSQKFKELDGSSESIDENWLRFYWQQILLAVNTIHEERIVHSDLKPANFLLVRGSLKLIDFGIAKAIMNDTTNIQRDSQVGTLSYMSPEAFLCNETDENGNIIKCGRASDIWSLGCILYQMVYGRTPFSEYKTFWAKFKVITDPNHEIVYEPVSNPWLLDLLKKCLAWDKNQRWRIPQLLQHPFLVPPVPSKLLPCPLDQSCELFQLVNETSGNDHKVSVLCSRLQSMIRDPRSVVRPDSSSISKDQLRKLLCKISTACYELQEQMSNLDKDTNSSTREIQ